MSFSATLSIAQSGLQVATSQARVIADNVANANTEGYSRRTLVTSQQVVSGNGAGVRVAGLEGANAGAVTRQRLEIAADDAYASTRSDAASFLTDLIGEPGVENGLFGAYADFESALRDVAATPESETLLQQAVEVTRALTSEFNRISTQADAQRSEADRQIGLGVEIVNGALTRLEELNGSAAGNASPDVADERLRLISEVNEYIPVRVYENGGNVTLTTESGVVLLGNKARTVEFSPAGIVGRTQTLGTPLSGLTVDGTDITPSGPGVQRVQGGRLAAFFEQRDITIPNFQDQVDALATDLVTRFGEDPVDPTKTVGEAGLFTDGTSTSPTGDGIGIAARIQINAAVDPQEPGGAVYRLRDGLGAVAPGPAGNSDQLNRLITAFTATRTPPADLNVQAAASATAFVSEIGSQVAYADKNAADQALFFSARLNTAIDNELSITAVDTDLQLQQLLLVEQAYAANAQVITTVSSLIQELLSIV